MPGRGSTRSISIRARSGSASVRVVVAPLLFRLPWFRSFDGYATHLAIFLRRPLAGDEQDDLLTHELCHVWQMQHRPLAMPLSYLLRGYRRNPYEAEARRAADATRARGQTRAGTCMTGRTSTDPYFAPGHILAASTACSIVSHSTM